MPFCCQTALGKGRAERGGRARASPPPRPLRRRRLVGVARSSAPGQPARAAGSLRTRPALRCVGAELGRGRSSKLSFEASPSPSGEISGRPRLQWTIPNSKGDPAAD